MEQLQLLKSKLYNDSNNFRLGMKSKNLLKFFADSPDILNNSQEAFVSACKASGLMGAGSLTLASRLKCEHIIKVVFSTVMGIDIDIDSITPILMSNLKEEI